jgi:crotonobetainyl-CoA:carnitine CoA-transferase CaiB-like acyl-CoA transferase
MKLMAGVAMPRSFRARAFNPLWNHYRCQDGQWLALAMLQADRYWADFARLIGCPELVTDPRFKDLNARAANAAECVAIFDAAFASKPRAEWLRILKDDPGDYIYTIVNSVNDLPEDPQVKANDYIVTLDHPQHGPTKMVGVPVQLSETPGSVRTPAPELGQHTEEILMDVLGFDWDRISALREKGVI